MLSKSMKMPSRPADSVLIETTGALTSADVDVVRRGGGSVSSVRQRHYSQCERAGGAWTGR